MDVAIIDVPAVVAMVWRPAAGEGGAVARHDR
jgi:hypothetical protein